ncbi:MAG: PAS domain S-box protein, partial [Ignavibacteria bacterium]|nr:PAS domain S-box protein [Ignavibacteria bacterium]
IIHTCNYQFVKIIGSSHEKLIGLDMTMLPDQKVVAALMKTLDGNISVHEGAYQSFTANKQTDVRLQFSPIFDSNGKVSGGVGMVEDISERVLAETIRQEMEERLSKSFYSSPVAVSISTYEEGVFVDVNDAYCRLTGFTQEQLIGKNIIDLEIVSFDVRKQIKEELNSKGYIHEHEFTLKMRNEEKRVILVSIESYEMSGKKFMLSTLLDITERKQYEQELAKLSRAVEQSPVSIIITDLEGKIEYVNPKVTISTGYQPDELIGQNPRILKSGETPTDEYKTMFKVISTGDTWHGEFHNKKKSGELYWESATISPVINDMGIMTHYIAIKEDITEWKKLQNELIDNELRYRNIFIDNP